MLKIKTSICVLHKFKFYNSIPVYDKKKNIVSGINYIENKLVEPAWFRRTEAGITGVFLDPIQVIGYTSVYAREVWSSTSSSPWNDS